MPLVTMELTAKSISDKADVGYVMTRVNDKVWNALAQSLRAAARSGIVDPHLIDDPSFHPTHVIDIYKMRRGRFKNVRIWINLHLGTGYRKDLFMTTADNHPIIDTTLDLYASAREWPNVDWEKELKNA